MSAERTAEFVRLTEAEREALRAVRSEWAPVEAFPRPHVSDRVEAAVERIVAERVDAARADERERWNDAIDAVRFYRQGWQQLRDVLVTAADRLDEFTYDEFSAVLDDGWSDDGPVDAAVAARDNTPALPGTDA